MNCLHFHLTVHIQLYIIYTRDITPPFMQYFQHYADILTKGLKKQHRWFGGWDIGRRLPFVFFGYFLGVARPSLVLVCCNVMITMCVHTWLSMEPFNMIYKQL